MIDVALFRTPAFSAASASVTVAFFALFGFIFLVTQYFQFVRGFGTLSTGVRILPVAVTIAVGSVGGVLLALLVMALLGAAFASASYAVALVTKSEDALAPLLNGIGVPLLLLSGILLPMSLGPSCASIEPETSSTMTPR